MKTKRQNYYLGVLGQELIKNIFAVTKPGTRSFDIRVPVEKNEKVGRRLEVKTRTLRGGGYFTIHYTRFEKCHSDDTVVLVLGDDFEIIRLYWIPTYRLPYGKGYLYFPVKGNPKYEQFRLV